MIVPESIAIGTIVTKSHLSFARTLARSIAAIHPEVPCFVLLADTGDGCLAPLGEPFEVVPLDAIAIRDLRRLCFRYSRHQVAVAVKPHLLRYLLARGFESALLLDADILAVGSLDPLFEATINHAVVLTPHLLAPPGGSERIRRELNILQSGIYNGGAIGVSNRPIGHAFLRWWEDRLSRHCRHAIAEGMHNDQRWLDLAPTLFDDVHVLTDAGCNVAYWNLPERPVEACRFFHFSGFDPETPTMVTRHARDLRMADIGGARALFERYTEQLYANGFEATRHLPYGFEDFDNGVPIPGLARRAYLDLGDEVDAFGDPFSTGTGSYYAWLTGWPDTASSRGGVTRLWDMVYRNRADLQLAFPDLPGGDREAFCRWIAEYGEREHAIDSRLRPI